MSEGLQRRDFLKVIGASGAGASLVGCSNGAEKLLPYVVPPEDITPGVATWYASVCQECSAGCGTWVKTREGRAIKLEGNPSHPVSSGALCSRGHAGLQGLYNPDRLTGPMRKAGDAFEAISWEEAEQMLADRLRAAGSSVAFLRGHMGPSLGALTDDVVGGMGGTVAGLDLMADPALTEAARVVFGTASRPRYDFSAARVVFNFGADFLGSWLSPVEYGRQFAAMSHVDEHGAKGKLVHLAPRLSLTGQNADEWIPIVTGSEATLAMAMASRIAAAGGSPGAFEATLSGFDVAGAAQQAGVSVEDIDRLAAEFAAGPSVAVGPGIQGQHAGVTTANVAVLVLNAVAGNVGRTVHLDVPATSSASPAAAIEAVRGAAGGVVMVHGANPVYGLPEGTGFQAAFAAAAFRVSFAETMDETAAACDLIMPDRHTLEAWGDSVAHGSVWSIQQPVMQPMPMFDSKQTGDVLLSVATRMGGSQGATTFYEYLRNRWQTSHASAAVPESFDEWWRAALRSGFVGGAATSASAAPVQSLAGSMRFDLPAADGDGDFTLVVMPSPRFGDGKHANRPWLQELPDPVSKITWQGWVELNSHVGEEMGLRDGDVVRVTSPHGEVEVPVWLYPGIRRDTVAIAMGGGHTHYGRFADGNGVNAMALLGGATDPGSGALIMTGTRVTITPTGEWTRPATVAGATEQHERGIAPAIALVALGHADEEHADEGHGPLKELQLMGGFKPVETEGDPTAYPLPGANEYDPYNDPQTPRWGMAIDLDKCTGCSACVTACQAENNVPWVGEDQVVMGREMHWMRIERYFENVDAEHAGPVDVRHLPMLCQHCGNAPCEPVCPVYATYHTPDGINAQIYNRCVGTRYCANNCPYKVRVFNWYRPATTIPEPMNWQFNPEVTVRDNGVMEKCSFCMQRVRDAQHMATVEGRSVGSDEVVTACQQSCPAEAIVFGNLRDPGSRVSQLVANERTYRVLDELINTQPAVNYMKKVTFHEVAAAEH